MAKKYVWLKLQKGFFGSKSMKKLRREENGSLYILIYQEMLLASLDNDGSLFFDGIEEDFASELALDLDEDVEAVNHTLSFLLKFGLLEKVSEKEIVLTELQALIGNESDSTERVRKHRENKCNADVTKCNADVTKCNTEREEEKEREKEKEEDKEREEEGKKFVPPTPSEVDFYAKAKGLKIDAQRFVDYYASVGWMANNTPILDWKAKVRNWANDGRAAPVKGKGKTRKEFPHEERDLNILID